MKKLIKGMPDWMAPLNENFAEIEKDKSNILNAIGNDNLTTNAKNIKSAINEVNTQLYQKVNQVTGKGLSTNDYDAIEKAEVAKIINKAEQTYADNIQQQVNNLVLGAVGDGSNAEVVQARGNYSVLNERLDKTDMAVNAVSEEVWELQSTSKNNGYIKIDRTTTTDNYHILITVSEGEKYWIKTTSGWELKPYLLLNDEGVIVSYYSTTENSQVYHNYTKNPLKITIPSGVTKLVVNSFDTTFLEAKKYLYNKINSNNIKDLPQNIITREHLNTYLVELISENYNNVDYTIKTGFMQTTGTLNTTTATYTKIPVLKGDKYKITTNYGYNMAPYVLLNNNGIVIGYLDSDSPSVVTSKTFTYEITSDGYLYVNTYNYLLTIIQKLNGYKISDRNSNPLFGKKAIFFGDSITEGQGSWASSGTIRAKNNMTGFNYGVGGSKYTVKSNSDNLNCIYNRIKYQYSYNLDADYIILSGLVNDALQGIALGTMLNVTDFTTECDTATVYGAFEMAIRYVLNNWKGKKVGFIITPKISSSFMLNNYFDVARNVCKKYSVPFLDLYNESGLCVAIQSIKDTYYKGDDIHPNTLGYEIYINDKVEAFMKSL